MTWEEIAKYLLPAGLAWCAWITRLLLQLRTNQDELRGLQRAVEDNARATRELIYYIRWSVKVQTGRDAPPYTSGGD